MDTAFQPDAFQGDAFQIWGGADDTPPAPPTGHHAVRRGVRRGVLRVEPIESIEDDDDELFSAII